MQKEYSRMNHILASGMGAFAGTAINSRLGNFADLLLGAVLAWLIYDQGEVFRALKRNLRISLPGIRPTVQGSVNLLVNSGFTILGIVLFSLGIRVLREMNLVEDAYPAQEFVPVYLFLLLGSIGSLVFTLIVSLGWLVMGQRSPKWFYTRLLGITGAILAELADRTKGELLRQVEYVRAMAAKIKVAVVKSFREVHSQGHLLSLIDASLGMILATYVFHDNPFVGMLGGMIVAEVHRELISVRWLHVLPSRWTTA